MEKQKILNIEFKPTDFIEGIMEEERIDLNKEVKVEKWRQSWRYYHYWYSKLTKKWRDWIKKKSMSKGEVATN